MMAFTIKQGTNISHWLSQSGARGEDRRKRFTRDDCKRLADLGLDHLRLPIDEEQMWTTDGTRLQEAWDLLCAALDWCRADGMRAIVDLHILRCHHFNAGAEGKTLFTDPAAVTRFAQCWDELSAELCDRPNDWVAYELLNEPVADEPADWNRVLRAPYDAIRAREPERTIAIGSNKWNQVATYPDFAPPRGDPNIILVFHYYNPMLVTHYAAGWTDIRDYTGPIQYPGCPVPNAALNTLSPDLRRRISGMNEHFDINVMDLQLAPALTKAREMGLPLWCNEFGVIAKAPDNVRQAWYRDFRTVLDNHQIAWANWDFRGGFGLFDGNNNPTPVVEALLGA